MKRYEVLYSERNSEFTLVISDPDHGVWVEHSGPYQDLPVAIEIRDALRAREAARVDRDHSD